jgi:Protein of unknown function (DUF3363)
MGLARSAGAAQWTLAPDAEATLREIGVCGDIIRTMNRSLDGRPIDAAIHDAVGSERPVIGRVAATGLDDELAGKPYFIVDGIDGRSHYVRLGTAIDVSDIPTGAVVRAAASSTGKWTTLRVLSDLPVSEQVTARGATWLDRELVGREKSVLAPAGFGAETSGALARRIDHLIDEGLARRGRQIIFASDLLGTLERRELAEAAQAISTRTGLAHHLAGDRERVAGIYRQRLSLVSGRFALIANEVGQEFSLVPWRPEVERVLGKTVSAVVRGRAVDWAFGHERGLDL